MTRGQRGYLAGMIDGEGSITAVAQTKPNDFHWMFKPRIFIANTSSRGIHYVKDLLEEIVNHPLTLDERDREGNRRRQYTVQVSAHPDIPIVLRVVLPDLVIKRDQAILIADHMEWRLKQPRKARCRYENEVYQRDLVVLQRIHALNGGSRTCTDYTEILRQILEKRSA
jgi:hypothetical protein